MAGGHNIDKMRRQGTDLQAENGHAHAWLSGAVVQDLQAQATLLARPTVEEMHTMIATRTSWYIIRLDVLAKLLLPGCNDLPLTGNDYGAGTSSDRVAKHLQAEVPRRTRYSTGLLHTVLYNHLEWFCIDLQSICVFVGAWSRYSRLASDKTNTANPSYEEISSA